MHIHCLQHVPYETPGNIEAWAGENGHSISYTRFFDHEALPSGNEFDALLVMGGFMSVHDEAIHPWLIKEKKLLAGAIGQGKKILGICLGAQLIADVLGARVYSHTHKEIGFMPISFTSEALEQTLFEGFPRQATVFHWHGDTFNLPIQSRLLASSPVCLNQAFQVGENILAFQFHLEVTPSIVREMIRHDGHELVDAPYIHSAEQILGALPVLDNNKSLLFKLLDRFWQS